MKRTSYEEPPLDPERPRGVIAGLRWRFRRRNPLKILPYLENPSYYRLAYQLAAQQVNEGLAPGTPAGTRAHDRTDVPTARHVAAELAHHADRVLLWFDRRTRRRWFRAFAEGELGDNHRRLHAFLEKTIAPSTKLLLAAIALHEGKVDEAESLAAKVRDGDAQTLSYRALYNLACYEAELAGTSRSGNGAADRCLEALRDALRNVYGDRRAELIRWAREDPAFAAARADADFDARFGALLELYPAPEPNGAGPPATPKPAAPPTLVQRLVRRLRLWLGLVDETA